MEAVKGPRGEGEDTALSVSHRPHRCTVLNCAKVSEIFIQGSWFILVFRETVICLNIEVHLHKLGI